MERYELLNVIWRVEGYYFPAPHEEALGKQEQAFERAKTECLQNLRAQIASTEALTFEQFKQPKKFIG